MNKEILYEQIETGEVQLTDSNGELTDIIFTGDFYLGNRTENLCLNNECDRLFSNVLPILHNKHLSITNLEAPLTLHKNPITKIGPHLSAHPRCIEALKYGNFDIVALANNHILDHGAIGLKDTLQNCHNSGIKTIGAGLSPADAVRPLVVKIKSTSIAFLNFTENEFSIAKDGNAGASGLDLVLNYYQILEAKKEADIVILIIHGGNEHYPFPNPRMVQTYRFFADLGVSAIIGHHPHCASGFEVYKGIPIFYSLGNFVFDSREVLDNAWYHGYLVKLVLCNNSISKIFLFPHEQFKSKVGVHLLEGEERRNYLVKIKEYSGIIQDENLLLDKWKEFCANNEIAYLSNYFGFNRLKRALLNRGFGKKIFINEKKLLKILNKIQCEAHREASIQIINSWIKKRA